MAIQFTVEDGQMPDGANTYASLDDFQKYVAQRDPGYDPSSADVDVESANLIRAADFLNSLRWKGTTAKPGRILAWPRKGMVYADCSPVGENEIPVQVINAQCEVAASMAGQDSDPLAPVDKTVGAVTSEKVDVIAVSYSSPDTNAYSGKTGYPAVDALLASFLSGGSGKFGIVDVRRG